MLWNQFKVEVNSILDKEIRFEVHAKNIITNITDTKRKSIINWVIKCKKGTIIPEPCKNKKECMAFIFKSNDNRIRGILTKEANAYFIELFLDKHKYYDRKRRYLGI